MRKNMHKSVVPLCYKYLSAAGCKSEFIDANRPFLLLLIMNA